MTMIFEPKKILISLLTVTGLLFIANSIGLITAYFFFNGHIFGLAYIFNFNINNSIPSLFEFVIMGINSLLLLIIASNNKSTGSPCLSWFILSGIFAGLALTKIVPITRIAHYLIYNLKLTLSITVQKILLIVVVLLGIYLLKTLWRLRLQLPKNIRGLFFISLIVFISGAIILDQIGNVIGVQFGKKSIIYAVMYSIEELLEMIGMSVFIYSLALYIKLKIEHLTISIQ